MSFFNKKITKSGICVLFIFWGGGGGVVGIGDIYIVEAIVVIVFIGIIDGLL